MLPKLESLFLKFCDSIKERGGEREQQEVCSYLGSSLPKVRHMDIYSCNNLFTTAKSGLLQGFQELEELLVLSCSSIEVVFDFEEIMNVTSAELPVSTTLLGRLE
ncbi:hypothetical protein LIER_19164 [Lithospermum erythrorhizon]|uniref:Disease resistance protein At4g27190-like leucine-rich repeats domain-containing protein n=1 Tax=Lithospermum erythrorhizon TaxID=34254 RepID=A0AAV3QHQ2_LITER